MDLELNTPTSVEVAVESAIDEIDNLVVSIDGTDALDVTFDSNEFSIVGDDMVVVTKYDDAPQWLKDTIDNIVNIKTAIAIGDLDATKEALDVMLSELEVAKNTYELSIISSEDIDERITTAITTLNSSLREADATILDIANTAVTPSEASAIALNTLSASLSSNGEIGSAIHNLQTAMTTLQGTTAESISYLESTMEGEIAGNASAMNTIRTYVGIDEAGVSSGTGLSAYLEGSDGNFGSAGSQLNNDIKVTAEGIESKWAYNSIININGVYKKSGFGLTTNYTSGSGTEVDPYVSEFWIDASRFKFTNSNQTGQVAPFTIDASGATPQITFNGKVSFSNVTNAPVTNRTYVQASQPATGMSTGDTWIDTDDNNGLYTYNGSSWIKTQSGAKTYLQTAAPTTGMVAGDIWVDSDDNYKQYRYNGSSWVVLAYNPATTINSGTTTIDGGKITTGSITASQIQANSISADRLLSSNGVSTVWNGGGLVSSNFNGNVYGNIGTPTSGFRLSSGAAGNTNDPNIYGAYIKGSTIEGITLNTSDIKVKAESYPNNFGRVNYVTNGGSIVMPAFGTGFYQNRVCSNSQSFVKLEGWHRGATNSLNAYLQYSVNGTVWYTLSSKNSQAYGYQEAFIIYFAELFPLGLVNVSDPVFFRIVGDGSYAYSSPVLVTIYNN